ncbi:MAG: alanine--tRNA ligase, partial [Sphingomonadales bacterium]
FTNAGMVQFKSLFTGAESRAYDKAASSQKCVRAGGKHNDLDNVGYTARHHTFFEMLGNFAFGSYFKEQAIDLAWSLLTDEFGLNKNRLSVTVYHEDGEAFDLWRKISGLPEERIVRIATMDNFWMMGDTGPCGPCSEIFYDHGDHIPGGPPGSPDEDGDRFVEIWNLVFMQFEQEGPERRRPLPKPSIDTGMGLERIAALMQGAHDNYRTDLFTWLIHASADATGAAPDGEHEMSHRVIADHLRAVSFLIADGVLPSNEGRGYVLRRIMRRAMRHAHMIGTRDPLMYRLVPALVSEMGQAYPELERAGALITETLKLEETRFRQTLDRGIRLLDGELEKLGEGAALPGEVAFKLYDTYGFPLDLTQDALRAKGRAVDEAGFHAAMERQKAEARKAWAGSGETATEAVWFELREAHGATEFLGYETITAEAQVVAIVRGGEPVERIDAGERAAILTNQTPFYGDSGGQLGDAGNVVGEGGGRFHVNETHKKLGELHVHYGVLTEGRLAAGDAVEMQVDPVRRNALRANHSATHLLHAVLRRTLGDHVVQKGSLVGPDRLRFDISHPKAVTDDEIDAVEAGVNRLIAANSTVTTHLMAPEEAIKAGAMALFGEKYGDEVRVVSMGDRGEDGSYFSTELCGGTHAARTGDIGQFRIVSEGAVGAGIRRIEALTGEAARRFGSEQEDCLTAAATALKVAPAQLGERITALLDERKKLEREVAKLRKTIAMGGEGAQQQGPEAKDVGGISLIARRLDGVPAKELRGMVDEGKSKLGSGVVALITVNDGKAGLVVGVTADLGGRVDAVALVRAGAKAVGGKGGGGRADMAQAGGPDGAKAGAALEAIEHALKEIAVSG